MKKYLKPIAVVAMLVVAAVCLTACAGNYDSFDTVYTYNRAIIQLPNGEVVEGKVDSWRDYDDGEQLQVKMNGKTYLASSFNCVLIAE